MSAGARVAALLLLTLVGLARAQAKQAPPWSIEQVHGPALPFAVTLDEGTWMSVDVSPDGRTIVFDLLGDLYTLPIGGGTAKRITSGPAYDMQPRFSPDGTRIGFISDRSGNDNIWTIGVDGARPMAVTNEKGAKFASPAWTPDGQSIVARRRDLINMVLEPESDPSFELFLVNVRGGAGVKLVSDGHNPAGPVASPEGRWIYFSTGRFSTGGSVIERYDRRTGDIIPLTSGYGGAVRPVLSPDGGWLAFGRRIDAEEVLVLRELETGVERIVYGPLDRDEQDFGDDAAPADLLPGFAFTPDGSAIILAARGKLRRIELASGRATVIPFTAQFEQVLNEKVYVPSRLSDGPTELKMLRWTQLTPDGKTLILGAAGRCYRYDLATGESQPIVALPGNQYLPALSPDGNSVALVEWTDTTGGTVVRFPLAGGAPTRLTTEPGNYEQLAWSRDGTKLALLQRFGGDEGTARPVYYELRWLDANHPGLTHYVTTLLPRGAFRQGVRLSFDSSGQRVYFAESPPAEFIPRYTDLVSIRLDGTDKRRHLRFKLADDIVPSPDGRWVAFTEQFDAYVVPMVETSAEPIEIDLKNQRLPITKLSDEGASFVNWAGNNVTWNWGPNFYRIALASALNHSDSLSPRKTPIVLRVPKLPRPTGILLQGARIITMGDPAVLDRGDVLIEGTRIAALGPSGTVRAPSGTKVFDLRGKTIMPGLVDIHAHYPASTAIELLPERNWVLIAQLAYGVTTIRDPSIRNETVFTLAEMVETGRTLGPRMLSTGTPLWYYETPFSRPVKSLEDARREIRLQKRLGATYIKQYMQPTREQRQWVVEAARQESVMVTPEGGSATLFDLGMVMDGHTGLEHAMPTAPLYADVISLLARAGTYYVPTLMVGYGGPTAETYFYQQTDVHEDSKQRRFTPHAVLDLKTRRREWVAEDEYHFVDLARSAAALVRAGGKVALGAHGNRPGLGAHWELWGLALGGFSPIEVLRAGTIVPAEALGLQRDIGSLEAGKMADIVVLDANPLDDIRNTAKIKYVMARGVLWAADTMAEVWPEPHPLQPFFWQRHQSPP